MDNRTGEINTYETLVDKVGLENVTQLTPQELDAVKYIKQEYRPEELAWLRFRVNLNMAETSMKEVFLAGFRKGHSVN